MALNTTLVPFAKFKSMFGEVLRDFVVENSITSMMQLVRLRK